MDKLFDWNQARAVLATAETGSLSAAARKLRLTQPTVGRQVTAFEASLNIVVFERLGRGLTLTHAGRRVVKNLSAMQDAAFNVTLTASGQSQTMAGLVRITASDVYAVHTLPRFVTYFQNQHPTTQIEIIAENTVQDLQRREADIAIRHVPPSQSALMAKRIYDETAHFYASNEYLQRNGMPQQVEDLKHHDFIGVGNLDDMLQYYHALNVMVDHSHFTHRSDNSLVNWELCKQGLGITPMAAGFARQFSGITAIMPDTLTITFPVWLAVHKELKTSLRIRTVYDALCEFLNTDRKGNPLL